MKRNRVRRIFRESFRLEYPSLPAGFDLVLIAASPKLVPELEATRRELVSLAKKAARRFDEKASLERAALEKVSAPKGTE